MVVVVGASTTAGATITGAGGAIGGATYTVAGAGAEDVVSLELEVSVLSACATATLPKSTAAPKDKVTVFNRCFTTSSPLVLLMIGHFETRVEFIARATTFEAPIAVSVPRRTTICGI